MSKSNEQALLIPDARAIEPVQTDPTLAFIERASKDPAFDAAKLRELLAMRRELRLEAAKEDFEAAFAQFKSRLPEIRKNREGPKLGSDNKPSYYWADLEECCEKLIPALNAVGITHKWTSAYESEWLIVTCVLKKGLYSDAGTSMRGTADKSGGKNAIQAEGSTLSYLERYTLCAACGIAIKGADTDAQGLATGIVAEHVEWIENAHTPAELEKLYKAAVNLALDVADKKAILIFKEAREKKKGDF